MRWRQGRRSSNIDDRRGQRVPRGRARGVKLGGGVVLLVAVILAVVTKDSSILTQVLEGGGVGGETEPRQVPTPPSTQDEQLADFVSVVLADTEDTWDELFRAQGKSYVRPKLVLFRGATRSACGLGEAAMGPFYCPPDSKVYIDLAFFSELRDRFRAPGDFAQAYVVAHEIGHHVQNLLGLSRQVQQQRARVSKAAGNALSVRLELQADCFAGVWAHHANRTRKILEAGDVEEGLGAASAIGDDRLQKQSRGYVVPESFTHGSSAQRVKWFKTGLQAGTLASCDTFRARAI